MTALAVAVLGPDQPGIVAALTEVLLADGGNLEDASMHLLRGQFAMTLVVEVPRGAEQVRADLVPVADRLGLVVSVRDAPAPAGSPAGSPYLVRVYGADRPGLVYRVTRLLAEKGGNLTDLTTRLGDGLYVLVAEVDLPGPVAELRAGLAALAGELGVQISLAPAEEDVL
ncbi:MAG: glycine cleavage system transcriptional repressor [Mycobacteriales bacterium]